MPSRGPGKYSDDLDAALHSLTVDGGADEEASYGEGGGWYGLMRDGGELAKAVEDRFKEGSPFSDVSKGEIEFLNHDGAAGVILFERSDGMVEVSYYASEDALDKDWAEVERATSPGYAVLAAGQHIHHYTDEEDAIERAEKEHDERGNLVLVEVFDNASEEIVWSSDEEETDSLIQLRRTPEGTPAVPSGRRKNSKLRDVSSKYGAPMGRPSKEVSGNVTLELVRMVDGDYDTGGAYWGGGGEPLWRAQDEDGEDQFFRAKDRAAAKAVLAEQGATVVRGSAERQNDEGPSKLETDGDLAELLMSAAESADVPSEHHRNLEITPELSKIAAEYEEELWKVLSQLVSQYPPEGDADANVLMEDGGAPINVFLTLAGYGVGIGDGRWDEYYDSDRIEAKVEPFIEAKMGSWVSEFGSGKLVEAIDNAVYENEKRLGIERDDDGNIIEREENRGRNSRRPTHRPNGNQPWLVLLNGEQTDIVYFADDMDADDVKRALVSHDGYDPRISVKKRERRKTHAPDAFAENRPALTKKELELLKSMRDGAVHLFSGPKNTIVRKLLDVGLVKRERGTSNTVAFSITDQGRRTLEQRKVRA